MSNSLVLQSVSGWGYYTIETTQVWWFWDSLGAAHLLCWLWKSTWVIVDSLTESLLVQDFGCPSTLSDLQLHKSSHPFSSQTITLATPDSAHEVEWKTGHLFPLLSVTMNQSGSVKPSSYDCMRTAISLPDVAWLHPYLIALYLNFADYWPNFLKD